MANHLYNWNHSLLTTSNLLLKSCLISCFISLKKKKKKKKKTPQMAKSFYSLLKTSNLLLTLILYHCSKQQPKKKKNNSYYLHWTFPIILSLLNIPKWLISIVLYWCVYTTEITPKHSPNLTNLYNIISIEPYGKIFTTFSWTYLCTQQKSSSKFT